jgi:hypothetical protein
MQGAVLPAIARAGYQQLAILLFDGNIRMKFTGQFTFAAFYRNHPAVDFNLHSGRDGNGHFTYT